MIFLQISPLFRQLTPFRLPIMAITSTLYIKITDQNHIRLTKAIIMKILSAAILSISFLQMNAQAEIPKGFKKGAIVLADNSTLSGYIKDNIRSHASVTLLVEGGGKKTSYDGSELNSVETDGVKFLCISGDFFKVLSQGELCFLQKSSDASGKPSYNGNEAIFSNGTEGERDDYFIYNNKNKELKLVSKKNFNEVVSKTFADNTAAMDKAKTANKDVAQLKEAIDIYNSRNNK
jgi:hypothetical protein